MNAMNITYKTFERKDFPKLLKVLPKENLKQFLMSKAVSGGNNNFSLDDLILIDNSCVLLCWQSSPGLTDKHLMGMRTVGYFAPFKAAVLNLTVIFDDHIGQKNLDPINKVN